RHTTDRWRWPQASPEAAAAAASWLRKYQRSVVVNPGWWLRKRPGNQKSSRSPNETPGQVLPVLPRRRQSTTSLVDSKRAPECSYQTRGCVRNYAMFLSCWHEEAKRCRDHLAYPVVLISKRV